MPNVSWILNFMLLCICIFLWFKPAGEAHRVVYEKIIKEQHDTILVLDTVLKYKIRTIENEPDSVVIKSVDTLFDSSERVDTLYLERAFLKCEDSLSTWKQKVQIDSETIMKMDTMIQKIEKPTRNLSDRLKDVGSGILIGVGVRSLF